MTTDEAYQRVCAFAERHNRNICCYSTDWGGFQSWHHPIGNSIQFTHDIVERLYKSGLVEFEWVYNYPAKQLYVCISPRTAREIAKDRIREGKRA